MGEGSFLSRRQLLSRLQSDHFDVLIIGGGATGAGAALDAASRGLKTALIEGSDFSSGTSSRSTKLVHGGIRYLERALKRLDKKEYDLVREALKERKIFLKNAPHLTNPLAIITPIYSWFSGLYYLMGLKIYDLIAGNATLGASKFISKETVIENFPLIKKQKLKGGVIFYDGQFDDARTNLSLILTAIKKGAVATNYVRAEKILKESDLCNGVLVKDMISKNTWPINAKVVINAAGPFADTIRKLDTETAQPLMVSSKGSHIILPKSLLKKNSGMVIPSTDDDRVLFLLPWLDKSLAGTTEEKEKLTTLPRASKDEVNYILNHLQEYLERPLKPCDISASFSGLRPLVNRKSLTKTAAISRDHVIDVSASNLITIVSGKWTTYRKMAEDVVDTAIKIGNLLPKNKSLTKDLKLIGAQNFKSDLVHELITSENLDEDSATHLVKSYGDRGLEIININNKSLRNRLLKFHPYLEAEIIYAIRNEYALHATDVIARRLRLAFLDNKAARLALPKIIDLMAAELNWSEQEKKQELILTNEFLDTMFTDLSNLSFV